MKVVSFFDHKPTCWLFAAKQQLLRRLLFRGIFMPTINFKYKERISSMMDLKQYGYIEAETPPIGLIPGRVTETQREQYTVITEHGEVMAVLKGTFYHTAGNREDFPSVGDFVWLKFNENGVSRIAKLLP